MSYESFGCRAKAEPSKVDLSPSFALDPLNGAKLCQGEKFRHFSINDEYLLYKGREGISPSMMSTFSTRVEYAYWLQVTFVRKF